MPPQVKIGLEIHGYLDTNEKLFCSCKSIHGAKLTKPNTNICPICTAQPGCKPQLPNSSALNKIIQIALILNCKINNNLIFQRKHYSWPDLPKGYQNTISGTYAIPVGTKGNFEDIKITEVHIEEDPAAWNPETGEIDYNRSGSPLVEIVTEPDFKNSEQVTQWLKQLLHTLSYVKAIDKTSGIKADVNVSTNNGKRVELKNINSIENIKNAIEIEIQRQSSLPKGVQEQETRTFNSEKQTTILMRTKEQAADYRFISDPDLPIIKLEPARVNKLKSSLPESPKEKLNKLIKKHKLDKKSAEVLTKNIDIVEFFEKVVEKINPQTAVPWITTELLSVLNYNKKSLEDSGIEINVEHFIELLKLIEKKVITELKAKDILRSWIPKSSSPKSTAKSSGKIDDEKQINLWCKQAIKNNSKAVADFKSGNANALNFLIGDVMKLSNKRADYVKTRLILEGMLK